MESKSRRSIIDTFSAGSALRERKLLSHYHKCYNQQDSCTSSKYTLSSAFCILYKHKKLCIYLKVFTSVINTYRWSWYYVRVLNVWMYWMCNTSQLYINSYWCLWEQLGFYKITYNNHKCTLKHVFLSVAPYDQSVSTWNLAQNDVYFPRSCRRV